ncbi:hypothetical protein LX64_02980 [Chitinophaga skermanii]|uniref:P pilus assembly chaperone PapD n=1 Tax=Chitinophaga skermanii TaxID=331697 RepID=A0A327QK85_9BACT|nr:hypothetical protein [Chitinophaga skermanii]RAJ04102.1 hypothetical protein LX64_02980 [Chitinophaga skermanii]
MKHVYAFVLLLLCVHNQSSAQPSIGVVPSRLYFTCASGERQVQDINLRNPGTKPITVAITISDWYRDSTGEKIYLKAGTLPHSCANWITLPTNAITLQPGEERQFPVTVNAPSNDAVHNAMIFFTEVKSQAEIDEKMKMGAQFIIRMEMGIHVYNTPPSRHKKEMEILDFVDKGWSKQNTDTAQQILQLTVKNTGDVTNDCVVKLELTNQDTAEEIPLDDIPIPSMPGTVRVINIPLPKKLKKGNYLAVAILHLGPEDPLKIGDLEFKR